MTLQDAIAMTTSLWPWDEAEFEIDAIGFSPKIRKAIAMVLQSAASGDLIPLAEVQALRAQIEAAEKLAEALRSKTVMDPGNSTSTWLDAQARAALSAYEGGKA